MIFVTGDTHGDMGRFSCHRFPFQRDLEKENYVIVCGDFGLIWDVSAKSPKGLLTESEREKWWLDWLEKLPFTVLFVDGNHENFDRLNQYPVELWNGGKVHKIRPKVIHLMRGQVFELEGKKIFTFGGARSHDIQDGILEKDDPKLKEKIRELNRRNALYRVNHVNWWKQEMPSEEEMEEGWNNLAKHQFEVDYIITHCCPESVQTLIEAQLEEHNELTAYFDKLRNVCRYEKWYFGHYHANKTVSRKEVLLYHFIVKLGENVRDYKPVPGKPRFELYQPVKVKRRVKEEEEEKIGLVLIRDAYGSYPAPEEPSYDILLLWNETEVILSKHIGESLVEALSKEEISVSREQLAYIATHWGTLKVPERW